MYSESGHLPLHNPHCKQWRILSPPTVWLTQRANSGSRSASNLTVRFSSIRNLVLAQFSDKGVRGRRNQLCFTANVDIQNAGNWTIPASRFHGFFKPGYLRIAGSRDDLEGCANNAQPLAHIVQRQGAVGFDLKRPDSYLGHLDSNHSGHARRNRSREHFAGRSTGLQTRQRSKTVLGIGQNPARGGNRTFSRVRSLLPDCMCLTQHHPPPILGTFRSNPTQPRRAAETLFLKCASLHQYIPPIPACVHVGRYRKTPTDRMAEFVSGDATGGAISPTVSACSDNPRVISRLPMNYL